MKQFHGKTIYKEDSVLPNIEDTLVKNKDTRVKDLKYF